MYNKPPFDGDLWEIKEESKYSQHFNKTFRFDFAFITAGQIKHITKSYVWDSYSKKKISLQSLEQYIRCFRNSYGFFKLHSIHTLTELTNNHVDFFISYLNSLLSANGKSYSEVYKNNMLCMLKGIIRWGQIFMPSYVPKIEIFSGREFHTFKGKNTTKYIPDSVLVQINEALKNEDNPFVKYGIIILQTTGIRLGDMLRLKIDCIKPHIISGYTMSWYEHKTRKMHKPIPVPNECAMAVKKIIEYTARIREKADDEVKNFLFIHCAEWGGLYSYQVRLFSDGYFGNMLNGIRYNGELTMRGFVHNHKIVDNNGEIYNLTAHQFRRTLATDMFSKGVNIKIIQEVLGHSNPQTTKSNYADEKDTDRIATFKKIGIIGNIDMVDNTLIADNTELEWFKENKDKGARMCDGYCAKPIVGGEICQRLQNRNKCYTCSRYITTPEYLQTHRDYLCELESQLASNIYGNHYATHIIPTIEILRKIISRLEAVINE